MGKSAFIHLVEKSKQQQITLEEVNEILSYYKDITTKTGDLLDWTYGKHAFPYDVEEHKDENGHYFMLKGNDPTYNYLVIGVGSTESSEDGETKKKHYIQITLPEGATPGDKGKGNELSKFFANKLAGELHLFNDRIKYYYKR